MLTSAPSRTPETQAAAAIEAMPQQELLQAPAPPEREMVCYDDL